MSSTISRAPWAFANAATRVRRDIESAFALHRFDEHRRRTVNAAGRVVEEAFELRCGIDVIAHVAIVKGTRDAFERELRADAVMAIAGCGERTQSDAMKSVGEGNHVGSSSHLACQFERGFDGIGARWSGELQLVAQVARRQNMTDEGVDEIRLGAGVHVEAMHDPVGCDICDQTLHHVRIIVTVIERAAPREKVDIGSAGRIDQRAVCRMGESHVERAAVAAHLGFAGKCLCGFDATDALIRKRCRVKLDCRHLSHSSNALPVRRMRKHQPAKPGALQASGRLDRVRQIVIAVRSTRR